MLARVMVSLKPWVVDLGLFLDIINSMYTDPAIISPVAACIEKLHPRTILDLGIGSNKWHTLAREHTDYWQMTIHMHVASATELLKTVGHYDLALLITALDREEKEKGLALVAAVMAHTDNLIVSFCNIFAKPNFYNTSDFDQFGKIDVLTTLKSGAVLHITKT